MVSKWDLFLHDGSGAMPIAVDSEVEGQLADF